MSKSIYDKALDILVDSITDPQDEDDNCYMLNYKEINLIIDTIKEAKKQEQEHIEYSKKVQEQFSNDTKRIGELESKLIKQENLLGHYKDLAEVRKELYDLTINFKPSNKDRMIVLFTQENLVSDIIKELEDE